MLKTKITSQNEPSEKMRFVAMGKKEQALKAKIKSLSSEELDHLNQILKSSFDDGPLRRGSRGLSLTVETAESIINKYPDFNFVSVGHSASWLIEIAKLIDKNAYVQKYLGKYKQIPFSGSWYRILPDRLSPEFIESKAPKGKEITIYRRYLKFISFTPQNIVENEVRYHRKTLIVDYLKTGLKLYSFISFILNWAKELDLEKEVAQSLRIFDLSNEDFGKKEALFDTLSVGVTPPHSDPFKRDQSHIIWEYLSGSSRNKNSVFPVISYPKNRQLNDPAKSAQNRLAQEFIRQKIILYLHEKGYLNLLG